MSIAASKVVGTLGLVAVMVAVPLLASAQIAVDPEFEAIKDKIVIEPPANALLPAELLFRDEAGAQVRLGDYFGSRPVVLSMVYYTCPMLCNEQMNGLARVLKDMPSGWQPGKQFDVVIVSMDPRDDPTGSVARKKLTLEMYGRPETADGWHFLTGEDSQNRALAAAIGFGYVWQEERREYAHSAGQFIVTPDGHLSRFLKGVAYDPGTLHIALLEATDGKIGSVFERVSFFCLSWDPTTGKYGPAVFRLLKVSGLIILAGVGLVIFFARRGRQQRLVAMANDTKRRAGEIASASASARSVGVNS